MLTSGARTLRRFGLLLGVAGSCSACFLVGLEDRLFPCRERVPQSHKFGQYFLDVKTSKTTLHVGDTLFVNLKLSRPFYDSLSRQPVNVYDRVALFIKVDRLSDRPASGNVFAVDTTIFRVFDQYFTTRIGKGRRTTPYNFESILLNSHWELELQYIVLKKGSYYLVPSFDKIQTGEPALPKGVCMLGDADKFNARLSLRPVNNQISRVFPRQPDSSTDYFGFVVD